MRKKTKLHNCAWFNVIMYRCTTKTRHYQFFPTRRCIKLCYHLIICISSKFVKASIRRIYSIQVMMLLNEVLHHPSTELACFVNLEAHLMPHSNCKNLDCHKSPQLCYNDNTSHQNINSYKCVFYIYTCKCFFFYICC